MRFAARRYYYGDVVIDHYFDLGFFMMAVFCGNPGSSSVTTAVG
jgi:hypothetical protein